MPGGGVEEDGLVGDVNVVRGIEYSSLGVGLRLFGSSRSSSSRCTYVLQSDVKYRQNRVKQHYFEIYRYAMSVH